LLVYLINYILVILNRCSKHFSLFIGTATTSQRCCWTTRDCSS